MQFHDLGLDGPVRIELERRGDDRGFFARLFCAEEFRQKNLKHDWVQVNNSLTESKGTIRGLHFQRPPFAEVKLVRCVRGAIFDVAVDLRHGSPTYGQWRGVELTSENRSMLYIPEGFGHGFQALTDDSEIIYFNSAVYAPDLEGGLKFDDDSVAIDWPMPAIGLSDRDSRLPNLAGLKPILLPSD